MGIILKKTDSSINEKDNKKDEYVFYLKGADSVMK